MIFLAMLMLPVVVGELLELPKKTERLLKGLEITVTGVPISEQGRINSKYKVADDGTITMWKIGKIQTKGKTHAVLAEVITDAYVKAKIYDAPVFVVGAKRVNCISVPRIIIGGQVKHACRYPWHEGMTLGSLVERVGGVTLYGDLRRVKLYRAGKIYTYNLELKKDREVEIQAKDLIEVTIAQKKP